MLVGLQFSRSKTETLSQSCRVYETQALTFFAITWLPQTTLFLAFEVQSLCRRTGWWPERSPWVQGAASTFSWWQLTRYSALNCGSCHTSLLPLSQVGRKQRGGKQTRPLIRQVWQQFPSSGQLAKPSFPGFIVFRTWGRALRTQLTVLMKYCDSQQLEP